MKNQNSNSKPIEYNTTKQKLQSMDNEIKQQQQINEENSYQNLNDPTDPAMQSNEKVNKRHVVSTVH